MKSTWYFLLLFILSMAFTGCLQQKQPAAAPAPDPAATIGSLVRISTAQDIQVRGIGIVAGLAQTGSSECPENIRQELEKYIWKQVPLKGSINPRQFIESLDTAVVEVVGTVPYLSARKFNVIVRPLATTQTTSLDSGYLYTTELKEMSRLARVGQFTEYSQTIATADGPIYRNKMDASGKDGWYVIGGGKPTQTPFVRISLNKPDFLMANAIRNRINERFGPKTCIPNSEAECLLYFPKRYKNEKEHFLSIVQSLLLTDNVDIRNAHSTAAVKRLIENSDKLEAENTLEGIGKPVLDQLQPLLSHADENVRFHAARCMLRIGSGEPLQCLRSIIMNPSSSYRIEAIRSVGFNAKSSDARPMLMTALSEHDMEVRLAAYEVLVETDNSVVMRKVVGGSNFAVDSIVCDGPKTIYVYQKDEPRIVLFGSPIQCSSNLFVQSDDKTITVNALPGDKYISISRKHPSRPRVIGPIKSSFDVGILLQTLGEMPEIKDNTGLRSGLAVSYADIGALLKKMCEQKAVQAQFIAGPEFDTSSILQESTASADNKG